MDRGMVESSPIPPCTIHRWKKITTTKVLPKEWGVWVLHWVPHPRLLHQEELLEHLAMKISRTYFQETQRTVGNRDATPKGTNKISHAPWLRAEAVIWKEPGLDPPANLWDSPGKEATKAHLGDSVTGVGHLGELVLPHGHCANKGHLGILPLVY